MLAASSRTQTTEKASRSTPPRSEHRSVVSSDGSMSMRFCRPEAARVCVRARTHAERGREGRSGGWEGRSEG